MSGDAEDEYRNGYAVGWDDARAAYKPKDEPRGATVDLPWRTGRKVGRTLYAVVDKDGEPTDRDVLIGLMDSGPLADEVVRAHNERLRVTA